jgi:hypothetical protein
MLIDFNFFCTTGNSHTISNELVENKQVFSFAKLKAHVRKSASRTLDALERAAANALPQFKPDQCANFFAHAGYSLD